MPMSENQSGWIPKWTKRAHKFLLSLPERNQKQIVAKIESIVLVNPYHGKRLQPTHRKLYRIKSGNFVIIYTIDSDKRMVTIVSIEPRQNAYKFK